MDRLLNVRQVADATGLSRSTIYEMSGRRGFPLPVKIGRKAARWKESEIQAWIDSLPRRRIGSQTGEDAPRATNAPTDDTKPAGAAPAA